MSEYTKKEQLLFRSGVRLSAMLKVIDCRNFFDSLPWYKRLFKKYFIDEMNNEYEKGKTKTYDNIKLNPTLIIG